MPTSNMRYSFQRAFCAYCHDRIWGLGRQGFKCTQCKLLIHKKCHKLIKVACDTSQVRQLTEQSLSSNGRGGSGTDFLRPGIGPVSEILGKLQFFMRYVFDILCTYLLRDCCVTWYTKTKTYPNIS